MHACRESACTHSPRQTSHMHFCLLQLCHYCLEALPPHAGIPCQACPLAWYCCAQHRVLDSHHVPGGPSCGVPWPVLLPEQLLLATRLAAAAQVRSHTTIVDANKEQPPPLPSGNPHIAVLVTSSCAMDSLSHDLTFEALSNACCRAHARTE